MPTETETPQIAISRVVDAPRELAYRAFTEPAHFAAWWGPTGSSLPHEEIAFDVRPGGRLRWVEVSADDPTVRVRVAVDLTEVVDGEVVDGRYHLSGRLPGGIDAFETRIRVEFFDEPDGRTRLEIRQWVPADVSSGAEAGWREALTTLDATLAGTRTPPSGVEAS
ncbi:uncharacterized protein YndB with AHSA1/START domain [Mumia flava]|uniref:Uncharacterized protein YndB with AHSA1/START domain n=1 Tax=Mumia flava TaxID=1348852 RepID=A0A0B2BA24_9ACTN|nr:SRPBCC domain-containing protein [Mumia flava]PJJ53986.1 uncharacterized protein YndB with AHSA1/START domain [Mumia flava]